jgi:hypothetical protein
VCCTTVILLAKALLRELLTSKHSLFLDAMLQFFDAAQLLNTAAATAVVATTAASISATTARTTTDTITINTVIAVCMNRSFCGALCDCFRRKSYAAVDESSHSRYSGDAAAAAAATAALAAALDDDSSSSSQHSAYRPHSGYYDSRKQQLQ